MSKVGLKRIVDILGKRHDAKELLQQLDDAMTHMYTKGYIAGHAAVDLEKWIPESEPPATSDYVTVKCLRDDGLPTWGKGRYDGEKWICYDDGLIVTHWRPAPEVQDNN